MTQSKKVLGVTLILLVYVVIAIIGFFVVYFIKNAMNDTSDAPKTAKITPMPAPSGFLTYQNDKQNFSISYPQNLEKKESSYGFGINTIEFRSEENKDTTYVPDIQILTVPKALAKAVGQDFEEYYKMADGSTKTISGELKGDAKSQEQFTKVRNREVNGHRAVEYISNPNPNPDNVESEIGVFIENGNDLIVVAGIESSKDQLEKVLKTFTAEDK